MSRKVLLIIISILPVFFLCTARKPAESVKSSAIAGRWYSSDAKELSAQIDSLLKSAPVKKICDSPLLLIVPHAGYQYSGGIAASGYRVIGDTGRSSIKPDLIIILGPTHYEYFRGVSTLPADYIATPLGRVKLNRGIAEALHSDTLFKDNPSAFEKEHSIEIQLPFLQRIFGDRLSGEIQVLPLLVGELGSDDAARIASKIASVTGSSRVLIIVSSDFTHYGPNFGYMPFKHSGDGTADKIKKLDYGAVNYILKKDAAGFAGYVEKTGATICGRNPIRIALSLPLQNFKAESIAYDTSGNITGDYTNSVSYASVLFCGTLSSADDPAAGEFTLSEKKFLLKAARDNISSWLAKGKGISIPEDTPQSCMQKRGAFVTLKSRGDLRGCVGYVAAKMPLIQTVLENSYNAAFRDSRFIPVQMSEMKDIKIEISVLTLPVPVKSVDEIVTGRDGLIMERGMFRGLLLPQVPVEQGWDRDTFLSMTCVKAGLPEDSWRDGATKIYRFQAVVFGEEGL